MTGDAVAGRDSGPARAARVSRVAVWGAAAVIAALHLGIHLAKWPDFAGWWAGFDQSAYLESARGWAAGDLSPARHYYPSGYALLAAPFVGILAAQPFLPANLAAHLATLAALVALARRLIGTDWAPAAGALACLVGTASSRMVLATWVVPWSTTPAVPLLLGALLLGIRYLDTPRPGLALAAAAAAGSAGLFRPVDAALALGCLGAAFALVALVSRRPARAVLRDAAASGLGLAIPVIVAVMLHRAVHGGDAGAYLVISRTIGFEPSLIPLRWAALGLDGRAVFGPEAGSGLAASFPWILPGLAGLLALCASPGTRVAALPLAAVAATWVTYLAYRDLQAVSLWRYYNFHYFKWTLPVLALGGVALVRALVVPGKRRAGIGAFLAVLTLVPWRAGLEVLAPVPVVEEAGEGEVVLRLQAAPRPPGGALIVATDGRWSAVPGAAGRLTGGGDGTMSIAVHPLPGAALILPLREIAGPAPTLRLSAIVPVRRPPDVRAARVSVRPGLPWTLP